MRATGASTVVQLSKRPHLTLASHTGELAPVLAAPLHTQLPANAPEKSADDSASTWPLLLTWEAWIKFQAPG